MAEQKSVHGRDLYGVFPATYPREILWARDILPVEIWDPPLNSSDSAAHLQPYICSVVKLGLELILQGHTKDLDGFIFPHTCDSLQNLASVVSDLLPSQQRCHFFYLPKAPFADSARAYFKQQLRDFAAGLAQDGGPLDADRLRKAICQGHTISGLAEQLYTKRAQGRLKATNAQFYEVIRQGEFLSPDDFIDVLEAALTAFDGSAKSSRGVVLSGILPNPKELLIDMDALGLRVVHDDLLNGSRRYLSTKPKRDIETDDPWDILTERYFAMAPCPTRCSSIQDRLDHILALVRDSGAKGVVFCTVKFCEPELFDIPILVDALRKQGLHVLTLDVELHQAPSGQLKTQLQAFSELLP